MKKKRGMEEGSERSFSDPRFFFTLSLCLFSHHLPLVSISSSLPTHLSTPSFPLSLSSILPSFIILKVIYSIPSTCPLFPFFFFFAFGMVRDVLPVIPPLYHLSHPVPERERGGQREEEGEKEKEEREWGKVDERSRRE